MARFRIRRGLAVWHCLTETAERDAAAALAQTRAAQARLTPPDTGASGQDIFLWALRGAVHAQQAARARALTAQAATQEIVWRDARRAHRQAQRVLERIRERQRQEARRQARRALEGGLV